MHLDRILGLSEHFVYSNDDMMLSRPFMPGDFFDAQGRPILWMSNAGAAKKTSMRASLILNDDSINSWQKTLIRARELYRRKTGRRIPFFTPAHAMDTYNISMFREVLFRFPELLQTNSSPLRTGGEISQVMNERTKNGPDRSALLGHNFVYQETKPHGFYSSYFHQRISS